jgi:NAD(P)-dependent dehydrogenase (short-subunit alcohol dehydrogenase family)
MKNTTVVITGASRGLGKSIAELLRLQGAQVLISGRDKVALEDSATRTGAISCVADVTKQKDMDALARKALKLFGRIDMWINNAGIWLPRGPFENVDMKRVRNLVDVNLFGTMYGCRAALPLMKKQGKGMIVNIISTAALQGRPNSAAYSASKYATRGFTDSLREEVKSAGISVIGIYPGGIKTNLFDEKKPEDFDDFMDPRAVAEKIVDNITKDTPELEMVLKRPGQKFQ